MGVPCDPCVPARPDLEASISGPTPVELRLRRGVWIGAARTGAHHRLAFGKSPDKNERDIVQLELVPEDLLVAVADGNDDHHRGRAGRAKTS